MTDPPAPSTTGGPVAPEGDDPAQRGGLVITNRAVERVATVAAGEVEGVAKAGSGLDRVLGHRYPRANATLAGDRARIQVEIAIAWPHPLGQVCGQVRDEVRDRLTELTGLRVDAVDVTAAKVVHAPQTEQRRVQ